MSGSIHLHNRLDAEDIKHIHDLSKDGVPNSEIGNRYCLSLASVSRILSGDWSAKKILHWGNPPNPFHTVKSLAANTANMLPDLPKPKRVNVDNLSHALANLISALQLIREVRQSVLLAGGSQGVVDALTEEYFNG